MGNQTGTVYALVDPRDGLIHYVGSTIHDRIKTRYTQHIWEASNKIKGNLQYNRGWFDGLQGKDRWLAELFLFDMMPDLEVLETIAIEYSPKFRHPETDALAALELKWMGTLIAQGYPLTNFVDHLGKLDIQEKKHERKKPKRRKNLYPINYCPETSIKDWRAKKKP